MPLNVSLDTTALAGTRYLHQSNSALSSAMTRLAAGQRVESAFTVSGPPQAGGASSAGLSAVAAAPARSPDETTTPASSTDTAKQMAQDAAQQLAATILPIANSTSQTVLALLP